MQSNEVIGEMIRAIKEDALPDIKSDIAGVNKRLDILNGKVAAHEKYITTHQAIGWMLAKLTGGMAVLAGLILSFYKAFTSH